MAMPASLDYEASLALLNSTERLEFDCLVQAETFKQTTTGTPNAHCVPSFDRISCWPATPAGTLAAIPCFAELNGVKYDTSANATRLCTPSGEWAAKSNYSMCQPLSHEIQLEDLVGPEDHSFLIYLVGYSLSLVTLCAACSIFVYFKEIHCLRNKIHMNLFVTYMLSNTCWILSATIHATESDELGSGANKFWCLSMVFFRYFHLCTFFWMFVEGLYLFVQVIAAFFVDNSCIKLRHYLMIGWGLPFLIVIVWASLILALRDPESALGALNPNKTTSFEALTKATEQPYKYEPLSSGFDEMELDMVSLTASVMADCPFMDQDELEYIYIVPIIFVLGTNMFFLVWIMWVVITKLRSSTTTQEHDHQHWKAAKALLVIIPLLGITYLITIAGPSEPNSTAKYIFQHLRAFLLSIQGFAVTLPYCFLNTEIRNAVKTHWDRYQTNRTVVENINQVTRGGTFRRDGEGRGGSSFLGAHSARNSLSFYNNDNSRRNSALRMHQTPPNANGRPRLIHQTSLPTNYISESSFTTNANDSIDSKKSGHATSNGKMFRGPLDIQKTIEEASDELKSSSFDQTSTLLPANNSNNGICNGSSSPNKNGVKTNGKSPEDAKVDLIPIETTSLLHPEVDVERCQAQR